MTDETPKEVLLGVPLGIDTQKLGTMMAQEYTHLQSHRERQTAEMERQTAEMERQTKLMQEDNEERIRFNRQAEAERTTYEKWMEQIALSQGESQQQTGLLTEIRDLLHRLVERWG